MGEDETNWAGVPFVPYVDLAQQFCPEVVCVRHPIRDLSVPTVNEMRDILDTIDQYLESHRAVYVHCWGGIGRTGTVIGCWLLRRQFAEPSNVLDVLMRLRQQDRERRNRMSPETGEQQVFVRQWPERNGTR
jgi:protein-tyrosine phosphatase